MNIYENSKENIVERSSSGSDYLGHHYTNLYPTYHVAISPNGKQIATFNTDTLELSVCQVNSLSEIHKVKCDALGDIDTTVRLVWSLAVSNPIDDGKQNETLIALSCFDESDMMLGKSRPSTTITFHQSEGIQEQVHRTYAIDEEKGNELNKPGKTATLIISMWHEARILTEIDDMGGLVRFLDDDPSQPHTATILVVNVNGISKTSLSLDNVTMAKNSTHNNNSSSWWQKLPFFPQTFPRQDFLFPLKIQAELQKLYQNTSCLELLSRSIENDYFLVEDYKDRVQVVEMYNLRTNKLEMVFHQREESATTSLGHGNPAVAISRHKTLLAYCRGANSITIYLMENSLEISTQCFPRIERILSLDFINDDESLFIIAQEKEHSVPLIIVWDLFSYMDNAIRILQDTNKLFTPQHYRLVRNCGNVVLIDNSDGSVLSILDHPFIKDMLVPATKSKKPLIKLPLQNLHESEWYQAVYHTIFYQDEKHHDAESEDKNSIIVNDKEPWVHDKYSRTSAFLDDEKTTQLIIGETTVQVWYRKDKNSRKKLKYIWVSPISKKLTIRSLEIGQREFKVTLSLRSTQTYGEDDVNIHWPYKVNAVNDACSALCHLYKRRDDPAGPKKQQQYENLVHKIEALVKQFIKKRPAIWRLIDVRYNVMASLIYGHRVSLVQQILNKESDFSMRYLHTPRLYEWPKSPKISDLEIAITCSLERRQRDALMVGFLLDYYSDNAMDNTGWMFTVSRAIPLLFEHHLETYAEDLFSKPIFGAKEIHLDESHLNPKDIPRGKVKFIRAFNPNTELEPKPQPPINNSNIKALQTSFKSNNQLAALQKVIPGLSRGDSSALVSLRLVPLPDFIVYPEGTKNQDVDVRKLPFQLLRILLWPRGYAIEKDSQLSPFLRVIRKDKDGIVFDNPAMEAVIDFKWDSARKHFLRHALLFVCYTILFEVLTGAVKNSFVSPSSNGRNAVNRSSVDANLKSIISIMILLFYYLGYYLLASEIVQFRHEGWRRYISVYNFFDLASIIMPLATYSVEWARYSKYGGTIPTEQLRELTIATSFTVLVLWMELFLLLRYFSGTGNFIYIIINIMRSVWPFIAFMGIVVIAHGHAMYLLLRDPRSIGEEPDGSQFTLQDLNGQPTGQIVQSFDVKSITDNYFSDFTQSVQAVYFWVNGRWDQLDQWHFWPVSVLSFIASVLLVLVMQNMLIAFMTGVFDEAKAEGRLAVLKYRSELIADYEALEKPFGDSKGNPRHIFYVGSTNKFSKWLRKCEEYWNLRMSSNKEKFLRYNKYYVDNEDDNEDDDGGGPNEWDITGLDVDSYKQKNVNLMNRKSRIEFYSSWSTSTDGSDDQKESFSDETSQKSSTGTVKEKKVLFKDTPSDVISPMIEDANDIHGEIVSLKDSVKTIEGSIDNRLNSLESKLVKMMDLLGKLNTNTGGTGLD